MGKSVLPTMCWYQTGIWPQHRGREREEITINTRRFNLQQHQTDATSPLQHPFAATLRKSCFDNPVKCMQKAKHIAAMVMWKTSRHIAPREQNRRRNLCFLASAGKGPWDERLLCTLALIRFIIHALSCGFLQDTCKTWKKQQGQEISVDRLFFYFFCKTSKGHKVLSLRSKHIMSLDYDFKLRFRSDKKKKDIFLPLLCSPHHKKRGKA